ncbi:hypothetical protein FSP39_002641 [Pinctada imbricata]|uniref:Uncharacterized protein n=1 Tax=Pinctada imbricata TaxID=66713 RepID=A0AA89BUP6_PINIB|nr:hypothetical protein FSP39_002641 [Pinctada imbricata]
MHESTAMEKKANYHTVGQSLEQFKKAACPIPLENFDANEISTGLCTLAQLEQRLKDHYVQAEYPLLFSEYINEHPSTWPRMEEVEKKTSDVNTKHRQSKDRVNETKEEIEEILTKLQSTHELFDEKISKMEWKINTLKEKSERVEELKLRESKMKELQSTKQDLGGFEKRIGDLKEKIRNKMMLCKNLEITVSAVDYQQNYKAQKAKKRKAELDSLRSIKEKLEQMSGLSFLPSSPSSIKVQLNGSGKSIDDLKLTLTMEFGVIPFGLHLTAAQVNVNSLYIDDILEIAIKTNDVPMFITAVRQRWQTHYPLAQEMLHIAKNHAVDWIREEGIVRVLLGATGSAICTLLLPSTYPASGDISLLRIGGIDINIQDVVPPPSTKSLTDWVLFLEDKFGNI